MNPAEQRDTPGTAKDLASGTEEQASLSHSFDQQEPDSFDEEQEPGSFDGDA